MEISMPGYIQDILLNFQHPSPKNTEYALLKLNKKQNRAKVQLTKEEDITLEISEATIKLPQRNIGSLLFYGRSVDMTILVALSNLTHTQSHGTEAMSKAMVQLLNYCDTHPDSAICYKKAT